MIALRRSADRGHFNHGWLDTFHTFSFGDYYSPQHAGFRALRVINEDRIEPGQGFPTHGHRDMEILTYVLEGALSHKDSSGAVSIIGQGELQRMSAGSGITHSEYNDSTLVPVHLLQIWIIPNQKGIAPGYEQRAFSLQEKLGRFRLLASQDARDGSLLVRQDVSLYSCVLDPERQETYRLAAARHAWVQVASGSVTLNGEPMHAGDGAAVSDEDRLVLTGRLQRSEVLVFDLA